MANFDDLKQKAKETLDVLADVSAEFYKKAEEKTKAVARTTKLSTEIAREKGNLRKLYAEIGTMYYDLHKDDPEEAMAQSCHEVQYTIERILQKQQEIQGLKKDCDICDADIEVEVEFDDECGCDCCCEDASKEDKGPENTEETQDS